MAVTQSSKKELIVSALCKNHALDPAKFLSDVIKSDVKTLYTNILTASKQTVSVNDEVSKWIAFADNFSLTDLSRLNEELVTVSVLLGDGLKPSDIDVIVFSAIHLSVIGLSEAEKEKLPHVMRWMDYVQHQKNFEGLFDKIILNIKDNEYDTLLQQLEQLNIKGPKDEAKTIPKPNANAAANATKADKSKADTNATKADKSKGDTNAVTVQSTTKADKSKADTNAKKTDAGNTKKKAGGDKEASKKKPSEAEPEKDKEVSVTLLNIQVGIIRKAWKHPSADSLLVEEIDVGEGKLRQVVSGLAKYCSPEALTDRRVALITNVKPGKLRDVMSEGLVLCASSEDHTIVDPLLPPQGAQIGERILFSGFDGNPEAVLNPKKKQLEKITPHLFTDDKGVATYKGIPFMTSGGPCTSSITKGTINRRLPSLHLSGRRLPSLLFSGPNSSSFPSLDLSKTLTHK
ncbi:hypothetical protein ACFE04_016617 [Oxalis oulophora]